MRAPFASFGVWGFTGGQGFRGLGFMVLDSLGLRSLRLRASEGFGSLFAKFMVEGFRGCDVASAGLGFGCLEFRSFGFVFRV